MRLRVGGAEIAVAEDVAYTSNVSRFPGTTREAWRLYMPELPESGAFESRALTFVIRSQGRTILVDSGVGNWDSSFGNGRLPDALADLGLAPSDIDFVLPTHMHSDHIGWNTYPTPEGPRPTFPRARYLFQQREWEHFTRPEYLADRTSGGARTIANCVLPIAEAGMMDLIGSEAAVTDEVTLLHAPGHTPGQIAVLVQSQGEAAILLGDSFHHPAQITETSWSHLVDVDRDLAVRSREALIETAVRLGAPVAAAHFNPPGAPAFGQIVTIEGRRRWRGIDLPA